MNKMIIYHLEKQKNFFNLEDLIKSCDIGLSSVLLSKETLKSNKFWI